MYQERRFKSNNEKIKFLNFIFRENIFCYSRREH